MRNASFFRLLLLCVVVAALPATGAAPEGILHPGPGTTVDGTAAIDGMRVFGGQLLHTARGRLSDLLTRGSSLRLLSETKLQFNGDSAELVQGGVLLDTLAKFAVHSWCAEVTPVEPTSTRYLVQMHDKAVYVTAQQGEVGVRSKKAARVSAGKTVAVYCGISAQSIVFLGHDLPAKVIMGSAVAATPLATLPKESLSASTPGPQ